MSRHHGSTDVLRSGRGWQCVTGGAGNRLPARTQPTGTTTVDRPIDLGAYTDAYATTWLAYVCARWPGGHVPALARLFSGELRQPGTLIVDLHPAAVRRVLLQANMRPQGLRRLLDALAECRVLIAARPGEEGHFGTYVLVLSG
jgi:hypothetical protein